MTDVAREAFRAIGACCSGPFCRVEAQVGVWVLATGATTSRGQSNKSIPTCPFEPTDKKIQKEWPNRVNNGPGGQEGSYGPLCLEKLTAPLSVGRGPSWLLHVGCQLSHQCTFSLESSSTQILSSNFNVPYIVERKGRHKNMGSATFHIMPTRRLRAPPTK